MDKKIKTVGLVVTGAVLLNVNSPVVYADEIESTTNENQENESVTTNSSLLSNTESNEKGLPIEIEEKTESGVSFNGKYDTLEEAESRKAEKESEYDKAGYIDIKSEIKVIKDESGHEEFDRYELVVTTDAYTDKTIEEAEALKEELEQDETVSVTIRETGEVFDHNETTDFEATFENQADADSIIAGLEGEGYTVSDVNYTYDTTTETVNLDETYDSLGDAKAALDSFSKEYQNVNETYDDIVEARNESGDTLVADSETTSEYFDTEAEAETAMNNSITASESHDYYLTGTVIGPVETGVEELKETENFVDIAFDSEDALNAYLEELRNQGYVIENITIVHDIGNESESFSKVCETYEEAEEYLNELKQAYTITSENIEKVADTTEDVSEEYSNDFDNSKEADEYKAAEEAKTTEDVVYTASKRTNATETEELSETFETLEAAEEAISTFESNHNVLDSESKIEELEVGTIYSGILITQDMKTYEIGSTTYIIIKHGNENVIWTENELSEEEQNVFIESYKDYEDNVITYNKLKASHVFTHGYNESNYSGNGKLFTFYEEDGKTYIEMASGAESRVVSGEFQAVIGFTAIASGHNETYTVNVNKITKGYDYKVTAEGTKEVELDSIKASYIKKTFGPKMGYKFVTNKHKKAYTYSIKASGEKTVTLESGKLTGKKTKAVNRKVYSLDVTKQNEVYKTVFDDDYELVINGVKKEITNNPQTGDNIIYSFIAMIIGIFGLALNSVMSKITKKNN